MKKRLIFAFALALGAVTLGSVNSLQAAAGTANMTIPHEFRVHHKLMPGGQYRLEQEFGSEAATLVNVGTGERVRVIWPAGMRNQDKIFFTLVPAKDGYKLKVY